MYGYVYKTTNLINGKIYIGQHRTPYFDTDYYGSNVRLLKDIEALGKANFSCEIVEKCETQEVLDKEERRWIAFYKERGHCYNIMPGGAYRTVPYSEEVISNMSESHKGNKLTADIKDKISAALKGRVFTDEHRRKLSEAHKGKKNPHSEEWRKKVSQATKGRTCTEETKRKMSVAKSGKNHPRYGTRLPEEIKRKISETKRNRRYVEEN